MIKKILELFHLYNTGLFLLTTALSFAVFALFYIIVYRLTAGAYKQRRRIRTRLKRHNFDAFRLVVGGRLADLRAF